MSVYFAVPEAQKMFNVVLAGTLTLDLSACRIGKEAALAIASGLKAKGSVLERLNLAKNNIGREGAQALAQAIKEGSKLS